MAAEVLYAAVGLVQHLLGLTLHAAQLEAAAVRQEVTQLGGVASVEPLLCLPLLYWPAVAAYYAARQSILLLL